MNIKFVYASNQRLVSMLEKAKEARLSEDFIEEIEDEIKERKDRGIEDWEGSK